MVVSVWCVWLGCRLKGVERVCGNMCCVGGTISHTLDPPKSGNTHATQMQDPALLPPSQINAHLAGPCCCGRSSQRWNTQCSHWAAALASRPHRRAGQWRPLQRRRGGLYSLAASLPHHAGQRQFVGRAPHVGKAGSSVAAPGMQKVQGSGGWTKSALRSGALAGGVTLQNFQSLRG